jgi:hypothetical protein
LDVPLGAGAAPSATYFKRAAFFIQFPICH